MRFHLKTQKFRYILVAFLQRNIDSMRFGRITPGEYRNRTVFAGRRTQYENGSADTSIFARCRAKKEMRQTKTD